jgi:UDP-glucose 4-epimerase
LPWGPLSTVAHALLRAPSPLVGTPLCFCPITPSSGYNRIVSKPRILVTGGAGYIGAHTVRLLRRRGYAVTVVDDLSRGYRHNVEAGAFHQLRVQQTDEMADLLAGHDAVVHFAAYIAVGESMRVPELYFENNVGGSLSLLAAMLRAGVNRLVFSSTAAVYGIPHASPILETFPIGPVSPYGESKVMVETMLRWFDTIHGLRSVCLRYFNACGADPQGGLGEEHDPETHLIPLMLRAVVSGRPFTVFGSDYDTPDGTCIRDYIHVNDLAEAHILAVEALLAGGASDQFNVGTGSGHSVLEMIRGAEEVTGRKVPYVIGARREGDPPALVANADKLRGAFGWTPRYAGLRDIISTAWRFETERKPG